MKVCVTGATGFIGRKLISLNLSQGHAVNYLSRNSDLQLPDVTFFRGDLTERSSEVSNFLTNAEVLFNCAGELNDKLAMRKTHVDGVKYLLNIIEQQQAGNKMKLFHWVQLSSCGAYGNSTNSNEMPRYIDESTPNNPVGEYECTKTEADELIIDFARQHDWFKYTIMRPTIVFGVGMKSSLIIRIAKMIKMGLFFYIGHKNAIVNFVHVDDVVKAMSLATLNENAFNQTFIISNDCRLEDFVNTIAKAMQKSKPRITINERLIRSSVALANKLIKLPINQFQIDVLTRQTNYSSRKVTNLLNWSPGRTVLYQLEDYIHECMH
jgi:nucleoside-diphosphate-sugar epimerase